jgi:hypothetical protein
MAGNQNLLACLHTIKQGTESIFSFKRADLQHLSSLAILDNPA